MEHTDNAENIKQQIIFSKYLLSNDYQPGPMLCDRDGRLWHLLWILPFMEFAVMPSFIRTINNLKYTGKM